MRVGTSVTEEASLITVKAEVDRAGVEPGSEGAGWGSGAGSGEERTGVEAGVGRQALR